MNQANLVQQFVRPVAVLSQTLYTANPRIATCPPTGLTWQIHHESRRQGLPQKPQGLGLTEPIPSKEDSGWQRHPWY